MAALPRCQSETFLKVDKEKPEAIWWSLRRFLLEPNRGYTTAAGSRTADGYFNL